MSQISPTGASRDRATPRPATWVLLAFPVLGCALAMVSAFFVFAVATFAIVLALGDSASPGQSAYDYTNAHFPNTVLGFLTGYPLVLAACGALVLAATVLATFRRRGLAILLLAAAAAIPWIPGLAFIAHLWSLPLH